MGAIKTNCFIGLAEAGCCAVPPDVQQAIFVYVLEVLLHLQSWAMCCEVDYTAPGLDQYKNNNLKWEIIVHEITKLYN